MNFNKILRSLFGDKSSRDMKLIQPLVEKVKAVYPEVQKLDQRPTAPAHQGHSAPGAGLCPERERRD